MNMRIAGILCLTLGLGLAALPAAASHGEATLGSEGEIYMVRTGTYGDLFSGSSRYDRKTPVLALDIVRPDVPVERLLVPDTENEAVESMPSLLFEETTGTAFLVWESRINYHPILMLSGFDGTTWSKPIMIVSNPFADKTSPDVAITHDTYEEPGQDGKPLVHHRTILHVIWSEENGSGLRETFYTPVIFEDGVFVGLHGVVNLNGIGALTMSASASTVPGGLIASPRIESGRDRSTVVVAFASDVTQQLVSLEIDVLPTQLARLADDARAYIIDLGARATAPGQEIKGIAEDARAYIIDLGAKRGFQPEVARSIGDLVRDHIAGDGAPQPGGGGAGDFKVIGDKARAYIIDLGAKLSGRGLRTASSSVPSTVENVEFDGDSEEGASHFIQFRLAASLPLPQVGTEQVEMFLSETGQDVIVSWTEGNRLRYRQSQDGDWSETRELRLGGGLDLAQAYQILSRKVRGH